MTSSSAPATRVVLFQVRDAAAKCKYVTDTVHEHFARKERFLFFVEDEKAQCFLDELLWKSPAARFLPHTVLTDTELQDPAHAYPVSITRLKENITQASIAFNLCPTPLVLSGFKLIYDFEDLSSPHKHNLSVLRFKAYKEAGFFLT